ncbi:hypothetical protein K435DRAFT_821948 [Dendrothele bispora CBS 962.96]|uniref:JmjC domain-containing protein n=1 Tax=Dendrothele bispora (strain CBS 962.96) TaxID=1314807 RepID=A0A4S8LE69_DENBC|nr:hypothetical protein K435DRAFT_821948 [Dendrothele bispora CBS 962.96]
MGSLVDHITISPITSRGWSLSDILTRRPFVPVPRVSALDKAATQEAIDQHERDGIPYIIENFHKHKDWPKIFTPEWLCENGPEEIHVRNIHTYRDTMMRLHDFIARSRDTSPFMEPNEHERFYGKDVLCPKEWTKWLAHSRVVPSQLIPDNEENLLQALPQKSAVETLMCYLGIGDTFTPSHKDLCASSGHNIMCYTEKDGSAFWFMTKGSDSRKVSDFFRTKLKQELDHETHVTTLEEFSKAPFDIYVAEQKLGDLVLVPPRSCHQVVNYGGITIKVSWSRMTFNGLTTAFYHELPLYRRVCRPETYRVKSTFYHTVPTSGASIVSKVEEKRIGKTG